MTGPRIRPKITREESDTLAANPPRGGKPLRLELEGLNSARRGDYRLIYRIDEQRQQVEVVAIEHRADAYRTGRRSRRR